MMEIALVYYNEAFGSDIGYHRLDRTFRVRCTRTNRISTIEVFHP